MRVEAVVTTYIFYIKHSESYIYEVSGEISHEYMKKVN